MLDKLLHSKAFWTAFFDALFKVANLLGEAYWPSHVKLINDLWLAVQPIVLIVIAILATHEIVIPALLAKLR